MNRTAWWGAGLLAIAVPMVGLSAAAPESLLPPGFDDPAPGPTPAPRATPRPAAPRGAAEQPGSPTPSSTASPVVQAVPDSAQPTPRAASSRAEAARQLLEKLPDLDALEEMDTDEIDELLGLKPTFDIPPGARRSTRVVGLLTPELGGMNRASLAAIRGDYVARVLDGTKGPLVSRWGHILLRRALASRLTTPYGLDGAEFAAARAALLNRLGEPVVARALVQEVDTEVYSPALIAAASEAYVAVGDFTGACPMVRFHARARDDGEWTLLRGICAVYAGESSGMDRIERARRSGEAENIDALLAQKYAGAIGRRRQAVNIEWDNVEAMSPFRYALASATGTELPDALREGGAFARQAALNPAEGFVWRARGAELAGEAGILSAAAMVDLYAQVHAAAMEGAEAERATLLREAYVGTADERLAAIRTIWGDESVGQSAFGRQVLTAYAAARIPAVSDYEDDAGELIAAMLTAGLDGNAMAWAPVVEGGSLGWGLLALADPAADARFSEGAVREFLDADDSAGQRKARFLVAGLAGLGRIDERVANELAGVLEFSLDRDSAWTRAIARAGSRRNQPLTVYLAALGMQGRDWSKMTPLHLYHITAALKAAGLEAEARMIAAEAVARG